MFAHGSVKTFDGLHEVQLQEEKHSIWTKGFENFNPT